MSDRDGSSGDLPPSDGSLAFFTIIDWYLARYARGESHTAKAKRLDLNHFARFLAQYRRKKDESKLISSDWDPASCEEFVESRLRLGESPATVSRRLATLKHMGRVLAEQRTDYINPARDVKAPRVEVLRPKALEPDEVTEVRRSISKRAPESDTFVSIRNQLLFNFLVETGLRVDEVRLLRRHQISDDLEWISQVRTKGKRFRNVYISSVLRNQLKEFLAARSRKIGRIWPSLTQGKDGRLPLFVSTHGAKIEEPDSFLMSPKSIWRVIRAMSIDTKLHPHLLRHTFAIDLLESSKDVRLVAQALGHSDVRVTMRYTERTDEEVAKAIEKKKSNRR